MSNKRTSLPKFDLLVYAGDDWNRQITWKSSGVPVDITGYSATMNISRKKGQDTPDLTLSLGSGIEFTDAVNGVIEITITDAQSGALVNDYSYDLQLTSPSGDSVTILLGGITFEERV